MEYIYIYMFQPVQIGLVSWTLSTMFIERAPEPISRAHVIASGPLIYAISRVYRRKQCMCVLCKGPARPSGKHLRLRIPKEQHHITPI